MPAPVRRPEPSRPRFRALPSRLLREDAIVPRPDAWPARAFGADQINRSLAAMEASQPDASVETSQLRRTVADCDRRLARHRAALEAGADPALVAQWTRDVQAERAAALARLQANPRLAHRLSRREIGQLIDELGGMLAVLKDADATRQGRGLSPARSPAYVRPDQAHRARRGLATAAGVRTVCVRGGT